MVGSSQTVASFRDGLTNGCDGARICRDNERQPERLETE